MSDTAIGIDFGTTNSRVGIFRNGNVKIIESIPSNVAFTKDGYRLTGDKRPYPTNVRNIIFNIKRLLGRSWHDEIVQNQICHYPFTVINKKSRPHIIADAKGMTVFSVEQIAATILKRLARSASYYLRQEIKNVVITVPASFNNVQRQAVMNAGTIAGLKILRLLNEPTAAAIAYGYDKMEGEKTILVFDLGGGTLDVSIVKIENTKFTVLATSGNTFLGGEDFNQTVMDYYIKFYQMEYKRDFSKDSRAIQRLRTAIERAKNRLTFDMTNEIFIQSFFEDDILSETLSRAKFEELNKELFSSTMEPVKKALATAKLNKTDINEVLMVGGSSLIPKIRELLTEFFDGKEPVQNINPDEAVAYGAAIEAAMLSSQENFLIVQDVNPLSIGIENVFKKMIVFIPHNTIIPTKVTKIVSTTRDYQKGTTFKIYEGDLPMARHNLFLGKFALINIQQARLRTPLIDTTIEIDANGILHVSAEDRFTKERKEVTINYFRNQPTAEEIEKMIQIAQKYDELEEKYNDTINLRNEFNEELYSVKSRLHKKKLKSFKKVLVEDFIRENLSWLEANKICEIEEYRRRKEKLDELVKLFKIK